MSDEAEVEIVVVDCAECGRPIVSAWWVKGGGLLPGNYTLVADCLFHNECWDAKVETNPP